MELIQDNHDRRVYELSLVMHLQFWTLIYHRPFQNKVFKFWVAAELSLPLFSGHPKFRHFVLERAMADKSLKLKVHDE